MVSQLGVTHRVAARNIRTRVHPDGFRFHAKLVSDAPCSLGLHCSLALGMPLVPLLAKELMECVGGGKGKGPPIERALGANHHLTTTVLREVYLVNAFTHSDVCAF